MRVAGRRRCGHIFNQEKEKIDNFGGMQLTLGLQFCSDSWSNGGAESWVEEGGWNSRKHV